LELCLELLFSGQQDGFGLSANLQCFSQSRNAAPAAFNIQTRSYAEAKAAPTEVSSILEQRIRGVSEESNLAETGRVLSVGYVKTFLVELRASWHFRDAQHHEDSTTPT
jgi:hypothetical protein